MALPEVVRDFLCGQHAPAAYDTLDADEEFDDEMQSRQENKIGLIMREHMGWIMQNKDFTDLQRSAAGLISTCKTSALGVYVEYCPECEKVMGVHYCSCNNRNCPNCQYPMQKKWVELRKNEVLPNTPYFHIVLTLPHELNELVKANPRLLLSLLFREAAHAVIEMCEDPKYLGAKPGIISVLHTWTQELTLHYHVHMICSAGGLTPDGRYITVDHLYSAKSPDKETESVSDFNAAVETKEDDDKSKNFFLPIKALTSLFCGKYMSELRTLYMNRKLILPASLDYLNDPYEWATFCHRLETMSWIGYIAKTFEGKGDAIEYLARYTFRSAISNSRIMDYDGKNVTISVRDNKHPGEKKSVTMDVHTFIWRFLSHILPKGFTRVRFYGILANGCKFKNLSDIHDQLNLKPYTRSPLSKATGLYLLRLLFPDNKRGNCALCGHQLTLYRFDADQLQHFRSARAAPEKPQLQIA